MTYRRPLKFSFEFRVRLVRHASHYSILAEMVFASMRENRELSTLETCAIGSGSSRPLISIRTRVFSWSIDRVMIVLIFVAFSVYFCAFCDSHDQEWRRQHGNYHVLRAHVWLATFDHLFMF